MNYFEKVKQLTLDEKLKWKIDGAKTVTTIRYNDKAYTISVIFAYTLDHKNPIAGFMEVKVGDHLVGGMSFAADEEFHRAIQKSLEVSVS